MRVNSWVRHVPNLIIPFLDKKLVWQRKINFPDLIKNPPGAPSLTFSGKGNGEGGAKGGFLT